MSVAISTDEAGWHSVKKVEGEADNDYGKPSSEVNNAMTSGLPHAHGPDSNK